MYRPVANVIDILLKMQTVLFTGLVIET